MVRGKIPHSTHVVWKDGIDIDECNHNCPRCLVDKATDEARMEGNVEAAGLMIVALVNAGIGDPALMIIRKAGEFFKKSLAEYRDAQLLTGGQ
jgi:hypothetical protein